MDYSNFTIIGKMILTDFNESDFEKRFDCLKASTMADAMADMKDIASAYAWVGGCRIKAIAVIQTFNEVQPVPVSGEVVNLIGLIECEIAASSPQEYYILEIPAPSPTILDGNQIDLTNQDVIDYANLIREHVYAYDNKTLATDGNGNTLLNNGVRILRS